MCWLLCFMSMSRDVLVQETNVFAVVALSTMTTTNRGGVFVRPIQRNGATYYFADEALSFPPPTTRNTKSQKKIQDHRHLGCTFPYAPSVSAAQSHSKLVGHEASVADKVERLVQEAVSFEQPRETVEESARRQRIIELEKRLKATKAKATQKLMEVANLLGREEGLKIRSEETLYYKQFRKHRRTILDRKPQIPQHQYLPMAIFTQTMLMMEDRLEAEKMALATAKEVSKLEEAFANAASASSSSPGDLDHQYNDNGALVFTPNQLESKRQIKKARLMEGGTHNPEHEQIIMEAMRLLSKPEVKKFPEIKLETAVTTEAIAASNNAQERNSNQCMPTQPYKPPVLQTNAENGKRAQKITTNHFMVTQPHKPAVLVRNTENDNHVQKRNCNQRMLTQPRKPAVLKCNEHKMGFSNRLQKFNMR